MAHFDEWIDRFLLSVLLLISGRPLRNVSQDALDEPFDTLGDTIPGQSRGGEDHALAVANLLCIVLEDGFNLANPHAL